jgi:8-oxo-dGTP diphosphatase
MARKKRYVYDYPRPAVTVDIAVVTTGGRPQVLLVRRKNEPFAGKWALPGGFIDMDETLEESARRELREETGIEVSKLWQVAAYGDPGRDPRGRTISVVYLTRVHPRKVKPVAADDAAAVDWFPLDAPPPLAFDHEAILKRVTSELKARVNRQTASG